MFTAALVLAGTLGSAACASRAVTAPVPSAASANPYATRLVLALDGIDYRDLMAARDRGLFASFHTPSRLISTFPSISDIAWHEILGVLPPRGYQRIYYSNALQDVVGQTLDAIKPIEFEDRMDMAFGAKFHHLGAYLISNTVSRREVDVDVSDFFKIRNRPTVYEYNVGPDALQHTNGDLEGYLTHLDRRITQLEAEYRARTGRDLEIVVLSDHGNNHVSGAKFVPIEKTLRARGFRIAAEVRASTDVAFSVDGVTTGFGVFCHPDSVPAVASALAKMEGVELVSARVNDSTFDVSIGSTHARIDVRHGAERTARYRYTTQSGDPLRYAEVMERMRGDGALDVDGFADVDTWRRYTATTSFPVAVVRIARGHTAVTLNPAPILVSILPTHRIGLGLASITDRILSLGGTHGSLSTASSLGMLMTNFKDTHDDITTTVREQLDQFADLGDVKYRQSGGQLTSTWMMAIDSRSPFSALLAPAVRDSLARIGPVRAGPATAIEVWMTPKQFQWTRDTGAMYVELRRVIEDDDFGDVLTSSYLPMHADSISPTHATAWQRSDNKLRYVLPLSELNLTTLEPNSTYELRVAVDQQVRRTGRHSLDNTRDVATFRVRTNARGELWPY